MTVENVLLDQIKDNPYNPRHYYAPAKVKEMAESLLKNGLIHVPIGRRVNGDVQLAVGHMRLRGYRYNLKNIPTKSAGGKWAQMPVDIQDLSDHRMFDLALEENLQRTDITPIEVARSIETYMKMNSDATEKAVGEQHNMTEANVSNMRRVLRLPEKFLDKIDEGKISFTQGRELLTLEGLPDAENLMSDALSKLNIGEKHYGHPNTVEGLQKAIHDVIQGKFPGLHKDFTGWRFRDILFDTKEAGCLTCEKVARTHPTKGQVARFCTDEDCWKRNNELAKEKAAAAAKAKMEADIQEIARRSYTPPPEPVKVPKQWPPVKEPAADISQEKPKYQVRKVGNTWGAFTDKGIIAIADDKKTAESQAEEYFKPIETIEAPEYYILNHTYRIIHKIKSVNIPDITAQDLATAIVAAGMMPDEVESVKVWKSSGKLGTAGGLSAGWSKCTEPMEPEDATAELYKERDLQEEAEAETDRRDRELDVARERAELERPAGELPCETCGRASECDRSRFCIADADDEENHYVCATWEPSVNKLPTEVPTHTSTGVNELPTEVLEKVKEQAGTRAVLLDMNDISFSQGYQRQMKAGYTLMQSESRYLDDPDECLIRCTHGFHFAFDSKNPGEELIVCSDPKCLAKKKGAFTRKKNAEGLAKKNAERKAIKAVIDQVEPIVTRTAEHIGGVMAVSGLPLHTRPITIPRPFFYLLIYNQLHGYQMNNYFSGKKSPEKWLWDRLNPGMAESGRKENSLWQFIEKLSDFDLVKVAIEYLFYFLQDHGDTGRFVINTERPLNLFGVNIAEFLKEAPKESVGDPDEAEEEEVPA